MKRQVEALEQAEPDVLVVGGGIHGAWAALEATLRGLDVALVERSDFGSGASANSLKILHGGFRYVPRARPDRVRLFAREQARLGRFAPELVAALPCVLPARRRPGRGRLSMWLSLRLYRLFSAGLERPGRTPARLVSPERVGRLSPPLSGGDHTGAALWHEGLLVDSERFVLAVLAMAAEGGAVVANYAEASRFLQRDRRIVEVGVRDHLEDDAVALRPRVVYNATNLSPGELGIGGDASGPGQDSPGIAHATGFNVVLDRDFGPAALGVESRAGDRFSLPGGPDDRYLFLVPWEGRTMLGTGYRPDRGGDPRGHPTVGMDEIEALVAAFDAALPGVDLHPSEVTRIHVGALPAVEASRGLRLLDRIGPRHRSDPDPVNLVSFLTTKYTTARRAAVRGVDACERRLGRTPSSPRSDGVGRCRLRQARRGPGPGDELTPQFVERAVSEEMALRLGDLLLRRTNLGAAGPPAPAVVDLAVETMGDLLAWDRPRRREERRALAAEYHPLVRPDDVGEVRTGREGRPAREADRPEEP